MHTTVNHIFSTEFVKLGEKDTWPWFLVQMLYVIIDMKHDLVIISDKTKGPMDAVPLSYRMHITIIASGTWPRTSTETQWIILARKYICQAIYRGWLSQNDVRLPVREPI